MTSLFHSLRLLRPILTVRRASMLGDNENGVATTKTSDQTPELLFRFPGASPANVTIQHEDGTSYGPFAVVPSGLPVGNAQWTANVPVTLPPGLYSVTSQAENSAGDLDIVVGTVCIQLGVAYSTFGGIAYTNPAGVAYMPA